MITSPEGKRLCSRHMGALVRADSRLSTTWRHPESQGQQVQTSPVAPEGAADTRVQAAWGGGCTCEYLQGHP